MRYGAGIMVIRQQVWLCGVRGKNVCACWDPCRRHLRRAQQHFSSPPANSSTRPRLWRSVHGQQQLIKPLKRLDKQHTITASPPGVLMLPYGIVAGSGAASPGNVLATTMR